MTSIPEEDVQHTSLAASQVFPVAIPSVSAFESAAKSTEDIPAATANEEEKEDEREATPPASDLAQPEEDVIMLDPPVVELMEGENNEAPTYNSTEANDTVMAEDNVEPDANVATDTIVQPITSEDAVPPKDLIQWNALQS